MLISLLFLLPLSLQADPPAGEKEQIQQLTQIIKSTLSKTRDAHAKSHGCVEEVRVEIAKHISKELSIGFFGGSRKEYEGIIRFSPGSGDPEVSDHDGGGQGLALKILLPKEQWPALPLVFGETRFVPKQYYKTFDILTISRNNSFFVETVADYFDFFKAQGLSGAMKKKMKEMGKTDEEAAAAAGKVFQETYLFPAEGKKRPREAALLANLAKAKSRNPFLETYNSWVPSKLGKTPIKYQFVPCEKGDPDTYPIPEEVGDWKKNPNFLSEVVKYELRRKEHCFKLNIQLHQEGFPSVEDAVAVWPEDKSPYVEMATITLPQKAKGEELLGKNFCEEMSFHPGHAPIFHEPVGGIQRARAGGVDYEGIYTTIARERNLNRLKK